MVCSALWLQSCCVRSMALPDGTAPVLLRVSMRTQVLMPTRPFLAGAQAHARHARQRSLAARSVRASAGGRRLRCPLPDSNHGAWHLPSRHPSSEHLRLTLTDARDPSANAGCAAMSHAIRDEGTGDDAEFAREECHDATACVIPVSSDCRAPFASDWPTPSRRCHSQPAWQHRRSGQPCGGRIAGRRCAAPASKTAQRFANCMTTSGSRSRLRCGFGPHGSPMGPLRLSFSASISAGPGLWAC